ncbi:MAG: cation transporter [Rhodospirillaceae bacterium]|nr:cation transporter [Rhodospirillaceae bacterium]
MAHDHSIHAHAGHSHGTDSKRRLGWALALTVGFMVAEVVGGILSGSLALLADAGHMLTDAAALALAWVAIRIAERPYDARRTYGYHRAQILAAFVNGVTLLVIVAWIAYEAVHRLLMPVAIEGGLMLSVAVIGLLVNCAAFLLLHGGDRENLNLRGAAVHVMGDLLGSLAAIIAAIVILATGWTPIDPMLSILVSLLVLRSAWFVIRRTTHILLEGAPDQIDTPRLKEMIATAIPEVRDIHHVHAWSLTPDRPLMTLHAVIDDGADDSQVLRRIKELLGSEFGVGHATIQIERRGCADECVDSALETGEPHPHYH